MDNILTNLPLLIVFWTACTMCWGVLAGGALGKLMLSSWMERGTRRSDIHALIFILAMTILDLLYLTGNSRVGATIGDSIVVLNIFYNTYLACISTALIKWWNVPKDPHVTPFKVVP